MTDRPHLDLTVSSQLGVPNLCLADLEALRLVLRGGSVVNWYRQSFRRDDTIRRFLTTNGYDPADPTSESRIRQLLTASADYIHRNYHFRFPPELVNPARIEDIFLRASRNDEHQKLACMMLKVAHVLNHIDGYELRHHLPVSDQALFTIAEERVSDFVDSMKSRGVPILQYKSSRKTVDSLITKLLSKRRTLAAQIYDKLRFRIVTEERAGLVPLVAGMIRELFAFNYVVPGESRNDILELRESDAVGPRLRRPGVPAVTLDQRHTMPSAPGSINPFSAETYRIINFVVDMPVRVDRFMAAHGGDIPKHLGSVVFVMCEFQVLDQATYDRNENGPANHVQYKRRQRQMVLKRLVWGTPVGPARGAGPRLPRAGGKPPETL